MSRFSLNYLFFELFALGVMAASSATSVAQPSENKSIGFVASNISGYGVYWDAYKDANWLLRPTAAIYVWKDKSNHTDTFRLNYAAGMEVQRSLLIKEQKRIYWLLGSYYYYDVNKRYEELSFKERKLHSFSFGSGLGVEYQINRLMVGVHVGYKQFFDFAYNNTSEDGSFKESISSLKEAGGISLGFIL